MTLRDRKRSLKAELLDDLSQTVVTCDWDGLGGAAERHGLTVDQCGEVAEALAAELYRRAVRLTIPD